MIPRASLAGSYVDRVTAGCLDPDPQLAGCGTGTLGISKGRRPQEPLTTTSFILCLLLIPLGQRYQAAVSV